MTTITVTYTMPEDQHEFDSAHHSHAAWTAVADAYNAIRNHIKHGDIKNSHSILLDVQAILSEAQWKRDL
jgi:hypothetical protein